MNRSSFEKINCKKVIKAESKKICENVKTIYLILLHIINWLHIEASLGDFIKAYRHLREKYYSHFASIIRRQNWN